MDTDHLRRHAARVGVAVALVAGLLAGPPRSVAQAEPEGSVLAPEIVSAIAADGDRVLDVVVVFADQPAADRAALLRPQYARQIDAAREPAMAALVRIERLLPPREERIDLGVAALQELEAGLLTETERAALRRARDETTRLLAEMRRRILSESEADCRALQAPVEEHVLALPDGDVLTRATVLNALVVRLRAADLPDLVRAHPTISAVETAGRRSLFMDKSTGAIGAGSLTGNGYNGSGQKVAIVDSGIDSTHPAFTTSGGAAVVAARTVKLAASASHPWFDDDDTEVDDVHGHGTHVGGTVASNDSTYGGVAPGARLLGAKCFGFLRTPEGYRFLTGFDADIIDAVNWSIDNGATGFNCSFGGGGTTNGSSALSRFFGAVADVTSLPIAFSAGNSGPGSGTLGVPGATFNVITVAAFDDKNTTSGSDDVLAGFSSRGPADDGRAKPDIAAPGVAINSCRHTWETGSDFVNFQGTSMASPHIAGAVALLLDYNAAWQPEALKALLLNSVRNSSPVPSTPGTAWGYGALDLAQAYADRTHVVTSSVTSTGPRLAWYRLASPAAGARATLAWNRSVAFHASGRTAGAGAANTLVDLDLYVYDESDGSAVDDSLSGRDNVEHVEMSGALDGAIVKIHRASTSFPGSQTTQDFALATTVSTTAVTPPTLTVAFTSVPDDTIRGDVAIEVAAALTNTGDVGAPAPELTLSAPEGWEFDAATPATQVVEDATAGGSAVGASWLLTPAGTSGDVTLTVSAACEAFGETFDAESVDASVSVDAVPPVADAGSDVIRFATSAAGATVSLDGSGSFDDSGEVTLAWDVDGDDEYGDATGAAPEVDLEIGVHDIGLRATDSVGNQATDTVRWTIRDNLPVAVAGADTAADEGAAVAFDGSGSTDVEGDVTYVWNFGDGTFSTLEAPEHVFANDGEFEVTLTVTDTDGKDGQDTLTVAVANVAPSLTLPPGVSVDVGDDVDLTLDPSDPSPEDAAALAVTWRLLEPDADGEAIELAGGEGTSVTWTALRHVAGTLEVTVRDDDTQIVRTTTFAALTPPVGDSLAPALELELAPRLERRVLLLLFSARRVATAGAAAAPRRSRRLLRAAFRQTRAARRLLARSGVTEGRLVARLAALEEDLRAGTAPPAESLFAPPVSDGSLPDLLAGLPGAAFVGRAERRLAAALVGLRFAVRAGHSGRRLRRAFTRAKRAAVVLPTGAEGDWYRASLAALDGN